MKYQNKYSFRKGVLTQLQTALAGAKRVFEVLEEPEEVEVLTTAKETEPKGTVEFKNVSFKYPDAEEYVLENISFKAEQAFSNKVREDSL